MIGILRIYLLLLVTISEIWKYFSHPIMIDANQQVQNLIKIVETQYLYFLYFPTKTIQLANIYFPTKVFVNQIFFKYLD